MTCFVGPRLFYFEGFAAVGQNSANRLGCMKPMHDRSQWKELGEATKG